MTFTPGSVFAGYTVQHLLGTGGMGEVYLARHPRLPRPYALKLLAGPVAGDSEFRARFIREADLAAALSHPNIVGVHDRGEADGRLWIAMDYIDGTDAAALLRDRYPTGMPLTEVQEIAAAVADALDYAHSNRLLHRDVKPANILLTESIGRRRRILLADFGIARCADEVSGLTATNMTIGTVDYAAPEQLSGAQLDEHADQYALASTIYHLLTGDPPFHNSNPAVTIGKHLTAPPPRLADQRPELARLDAVFAVALAKDPASRFPCCRDFADALAAPAATDAAAPTLPARIARTDNSPSNQHRWSASTVVPTLLVALLVAASAFAATQFLRGDPQAVPAIPQWQPYVDTASSYVQNMYTYTADSVDRTVEQSLATSTNPLHDTLSDSAGELKALLRDQGSSSCTINSTGLEALNGTEASVLVAMRATVTNADGQAGPSTPYAIRVMVRQVGGQLKVADLKWPDGEK